jgi:pimeloyl-ACP methyl ester carboxylesterase
MNIKKIIAVLMFFIISISGLSIVGNKTYAASFTDEQYELLAKLQILQEEAIANCGEEKASASHHAPAEFESKLDEYSDFPTEGGIAMRLKQPPGDHISIKTTVFDSASTASNYIKYIKDLPGNLLVGSDYKEPEKKTHPVNGKNALSYGRISKRSETDVPSWSRVHLNNGIFLIEITVYHEIKDKHIKLLKEMDSLITEKLETMTLEDEEEKETETTALTTTRQTTKETSIEKEEVMDFKLELESDYTAVIADGKLSINIELTFPDNAQGSFQVNEKENNGQIKDIKYLKKINLSSKTRKTVLEFIPQEYIYDDKNYSINKVINSAEYGELSLWFRKDMLTVDYFNSDGELIKSKDIEILVAKPPVFLVHGFLGNESTWEKIDGVLKSDKYATIRKSYYNKSGVYETIPAQSNLLLSQINDLRNIYKDNKIKLKSVDIVAHSMGGLLSRHMISKLSGYDGHARKLIMVGTPNHGCNYMDLQAGRLMSWSAQKHIVAAEQLYGNSPFILELNEGEETGKHLREGVEYGIIYGTDTLFGDGVVSTTSALLNGVRSYEIQGALHSPAVNILGGFMYDPITTSDKTFEKVKEWLSETIRKVPLKKYKTILTHTVGSCSYNEVFGKNKELEEGAKNLELKPYNTIITKKGLAHVQLFEGSLAYGEIYIGEDTEIAILYTSQKAIEVVLLQGNARFKTYGLNGDKHFNVFISAKDNIYQTVRGLDTDFIVSFDRQNNKSGVVSLEGRVSIDNLKDNTFEYTSTVIKKEQGTIIENNNIGGVLMSDDVDIETDWLENEIFEDRGSITVFIFNKIITVRNPLAPYLKGFYNFVEGIGGKKLVSIVDIVIMVILAIIALMFVFIILKIIRKIFFRKKQK